MKSPNDHWNNLVRKAVERNPSLTQEQLDAMKLPFMVCYEMMSHEFAIDDPQKIAEFAEKLNQLFGEKKNGLHEQVQALERKAP